MENEKTAKKPLDKVKGFFLFLGRYFASRGVGFYLLLPVVIISIIEPIVYSGGFFKTEYESMITFVLPLLIIPCFALAFFKPTAKYAPIAMFVVALISLLEFIRNTYMHLSTAFFGGISGNVLVQAGFAFSFCTIALVLEILLCAVAMFFKQFRGKKQAEPVARPVKEETV